MEFDKSAFIRNPVSRQPIYSCFVGYTFPKAAIEFAFLASTGVLAGGLNALAGGGSFLSLPALLYLQVPPVAANATSTFATWPGLLSAFWGYRKRLRPHVKAVLVLSAVSLVGGTAGGLLLLATPAEAFSRMIPYLLLFATLLFLLSLRRADWARPDAITEASPERALPRRALDIRSLGQFLVSLYGGYFAGGVGILQIATLSAFGVEDLQFILGLKNLLGVLMSGASLLTLVMGAKIAWRAAAALTSGAMAGGYLGGRLAQRIDPRWMRVLVTVLCVTVTTIFFLKHR